MRRKIDRRFFLLMKNFVIILFLLIFASCKKPEKRQETKDVQNNITCTNEGCKGFYEGPEFLNGSDVAHQFSNEMSEKVGEKLKELYQSKNYSKVDFDKIEISTIGMNSGNVKYNLEIPFGKVKNKCDAYTSFDHVGGWNHKPALEERKIQLQNALLKDDSLNISKLQITQEGLHEYWIQWKNKDLQKDCFLIDEFSTIILVSSSNKHKLLNPLCDLKSL